MTKLPSNIILGDRSNRPTRIIPQSDPLVEIIPVRTWQLLNLLADGKFHSGEVLAKTLNISRASVFNALSGVANFGLELHRVRGRGYRLARPWQRLSAEEVKRELTEDAEQFNIEIVPQTTSSNTLLLKRAGLDVASSPSGSVLAVELQTAGRGRLGRTWCSSLGCSLTFSMLWRFDCGLNGLSGLSLVVGVAIVRALKRLGAQGVWLKWPNDILTINGKLGGVLIEAQGDMYGPSAAVIGIGLNCTLPDKLAKRIDQPACALSEVFTDMPTRNHLLAALIHELAGALRQFAAGGFTPFAREWESYHLYQGQTIQMRKADDTVVPGLVRGISDRGELCLETEEGIAQFNSGDLESVR
jgi:BirA family biotin operon repressor/biotin-[acetyl-CoA-carboxylase] ligase